MLVEGKLVSFERSGRKIGLFKKSFHRALVNKSFYYEIFAAYMCDIVDKKVNDLFSLVCKLSETEL